MATSRIELKVSQIPIMERLLKGFQMFADGTHEAHLFRVGENLIRWGHRENENDIEIELEKRA